MQTVSELYSSILAGAHSYEIQLDVSGTVYGMSELIRVRSSAAAFGSDSPAVGGCVAGEIDVELRAELGSIPRMARLRPYARVTDGTRTSEWIQTGEYFVDTRSATTQGGTPTATLHGYDAMLRAEAMYPSTSGQTYPATDIAVVQIVANAMGVVLDSRTTAEMTKGYSVPYPGGMSCREVLGYIAAMYGGCFCITSVGKLRLIRLGDIPPETNYLIDEDGDAITFGGDCILV